MTHTDFRQHLTANELNYAEHYVTLGGAKITRKRASQLCAIFGKIIPRHGYEIDLAETKHEKLILKYESGRFNLRIWTSPNINFR